MKRKNNNFRAIVRCFVVAAFFFIILFTVKRVARHGLDMNQNKKENDNLIEEVLRPIENGEDGEDDNLIDGEKPKKGSTIKPGAVSVDFNKLKTINTDVRGWIMFNGFYVNNPIVQTTNNEYYLNHTVYRGINEAGSIFMDYRNKSFEDKNVVIYGHATIDRSMFGSLTDVFTSSFWNTPNADIIYLYDVNNKLMKYQIFSYYTIESEEYYITTSFRNDASFQQFIETIKGRSLQNRNVSVTVSDKILTLSTCAGSSGTNMRRVIHAKRL